MTCISILYELIFFSLKNNFVGCFYSLYNCAYLSCFVSQNQPIIFSAPILKLLSSSISLKFSPCSMDSTPPSSKIMKTSGVKKGGRLESWFPEEDENIENTYMKQVERLSTIRSSFYSIG